MKINWKVRLKNPTFWITVIPAVISAVYGVLAVIGVIPKVEEGTLISAFMAIVGVLSAIGIINDPTTKGIEDSDRAMTYAVPNDDSNSPTFLQKIFKKIIMR